MAQVLHNKNLATRFQIMVEIAARPNEPVGDAAIQYVNPMSDFLFVARRAVNNNGAGDVLWVPGLNR